MSAAICGAEDRAWESRMSLRSSGLRFLCCLSPKADAEIAADDEVARALQLAAIVETGLNGRPATVVDVVAVSPARRARRPRVVGVIAISIIPVAAIEAAGQAAPGQDADAGIAADL